MQVGSAHYNPTTPTDGIAVRQAPGGSTVTRPAELPPLRGGAGRSRDDASSGSTVTTYKYAVFPDGTPYVTGAEVNAPQERAADDDSPRTGFPSGGEDAVRASPTERRDRGSGDVVSDDEANAKPEDDPQVRTQINELKQIEREVIAHEMAHMAVGGRFAGGVSYSYTQGPDGKKYITGGEVPIGTPATDDPEEALRNAEQVQRAALAPANPSSQDLAVAAAAAQTQAQARAEIAKQRALETNGDDADTPAVEEKAGQTTAARLGEDDEDPTVAETGNSLWKLAADSFKTVRAQDRKSVV